MDVAERAKQFMPFAALKGLPEALAEKERTVLSRAELSEEMAEELDRKIERLEQLEPGRMVTVVYFERDGYREVTGAMTRVDRDGRTLQVADVRVRAEDIREIEMV